MRQRVGPFYSFVFDPPTRAGIRRSLRSPRRRLVVGSAALLLCAAAWLLAGHGGNAFAAPAVPPRVAAAAAVGLAGGRQLLATAGASIHRHIPLLKEPPDESESLTVTSTPAGALIEIDGRDRGRTPASITVASGDHRIRLRRDGYGESSGQVRVAHGQPATFEAELWRRVPVMQHLRPSYPGASIETASFLADGSVAVTLALSADGERQVWIVASPPDPVEGTSGDTPSSATATDAAGQLPSRIGPDGLGAGVAVAPRTRRIAYLKRAARTVSGGSLDAASWASAGIAGGLTEVWTAAPDGSGAERRYVVPAISATPATPGVSSGQRLVDVTWAPDETHLLVVARGGIAGGGVGGGTGSANRTYVRWIDVSQTATAPGERASVRDLVTLPADIVPGSYRWTAASNRVAFLTRSGQVTSLCTLDATTGQFSYLADVAQGGTGPGIAPLAWSPDGRLVAYTALAPERPSSSPLKWVTRSKTPVDLFTMTAGVDGTYGPPRMVGSALGDAHALGQWPGWRRDGSLVLLGRPSSAGPLVVRTKEPGNPAGQAHDLAVLAGLPSTITAYTATWDIAGAQALISVRTTAGSSTSRLDYWLVRFRAQSSAETEANR